MGRVTYVCLHVQIAGTLLELYNACCRGDPSVLQRLQQLQERQATGAHASMKQVVSGCGSMGMGIWSARCFCCMA
jgi:hypothetical protein